MDTGAVRARIKMALDTVDEITGYVRKPDVIQRGDSWPLWRSSERPDDAGFTFLLTFDVVVVVGQSDPDSVVDTWGEALIEALDPAVMSVTNMVPAVVASSAGDMNALMITGRCE